MLRIQCALILASLSGCLSVPLQEGAPLQPAPKPNERIPARPLPNVELIVVRHAFSCANVEKRMKNYNLFDFKAANEHKSFNKVRALEKGAAAAAAETLSQRTRRPE